MKNAEVENISGTIYMMEEMTQQLSIYMPKYRQFYLQIQSKTFRIRRILSHTSPSKRYAEPPLRNRRSCWYPRDPCIVV